MKQNYSSTTSTTARIIVVFVMLLAFIFSTVAAYAETGESFAPIEKNFKPRSTRDPFMPCVGKKIDQVPVKQTVTTIKDEGKKGTEKVVNSGRIDRIAPPVSDNQVKKGVQLVDVSDQIQVTGIMRSGGVNNAIVTHDGNGYLVKSGQKLGEWTVSSVTDRTVVLRAKNYKAVLKLESDITNPKGGGIPAPGK